MLRDWPWPRWAIPIASICASHAGPLSPERSLRAIAGSEGQRWRRLTRRFLSDAKQLRMAEKDIDGAALGISHEQGARPAYGFGMRLAHHRFEERQDVVLTAEEERVGLQHGEDVQRKQVGEFDMDQGMSPAFGSDQTPVAIWIHFVRLRELRPLQAE